MKASISTVNKRFYSLIAIFALSAAGLVAVSVPASAAVVETLTFSPSQTFIIETGTAASFRVIPNSEPVAGNGRMDWAPFSNASLNASSLVDWLLDGGAWNKGWKVKNDVGTTNPVLYVQKPLNSNLGSSLTLLNRTDTQTILSVDNKVVTAKIKATTAAVKVAMRISNNIGESMTVSSVTGAANQWSALTFNFAGIGAIGKFDSQTSYKKLELILDTDHLAAGATGASGGPEPQGAPAASTSKLYLIDDVQYTLAPAPRGTSVVSHRFNAPGSTGLLANPVNRGLQPWFSFYHSTVQYYSAVALIGTTLSLKWRVTDSSGLPAVNTRVNLLVNKEFSGSNAIFTSPGIVFTDTQTTIAGTTDGSGYVSFTLTNKNTGGLASPDIKAPNPVRAGDKFTQVALLLPGGNQKNEGQDIIDIIFVSNSPSPTPSGSPSPSPSASPSPSSTPTASAPPIKVTFETSDTSGYSRIDFNTNVSSISTPPAGGTAGSLSAMKIVKGADGAAGTTFLKTGASGKTLASSAQKKVTMKVYSAVAGKKVMLKVEDALHPEKCVEAFATETTGVGWKTLTFDFSSERTGTQAFNSAYTYNMASIFFDFLGTTAGAIYYVDDIEFNSSGTTTPTGSPSPSPSATVGAALTPTFSSPIANATGFTVNVTNYNASYTFTPSLIAGSGSVTAGTAAGSVRPISVTGVTAGAATLQIATSRAGYTAGSATVSGNALPAISSLSTSSTTRGVAVTITGTNLWAATAVRVGTSTTASTKFTVVSATSIIFNTALAATGAVTVVTPGGTATGPSITISGTPTAPGTVTISATTGGPGTAIVLTGTNLGAATAVARGAASIPFKVIATNQLLLAIPAGLVTGAFTITTPGGTASSPSYTASTSLASRTVTSAAQTIKRSTLATITGTNLGAITAITINGTAVTDYTVTSATSINVRIPVTAAIGASTIVITTAGGTVSTSTVTIS